MLVVTRHKSEAIIVGDDKVRLGIDCPRGIAVDRVEVRHDKERQGRDGQEGDAA